VLCVYKSTRYAKEPDNLIALIETSVKAKREEGSPFADPTLDKLVGHSVKAEGLADQRHPDHAQLEDDGLAVL
jgi:hypothetical protein